MDIIEFVFIVLLFELTPGPNMAYLAILALERGRIAAFAAVFGVAAGLSVHAVLAAVGVGALITQWPLLYEILRWTGVGYLFYLAWESWQPERGSGMTLNAQAQKRKLFWRGFIANVFNPKSILLFVTVVPRFTDAAAAQPLIAQLALLGAIYVMIATGIHATIVTLAAQLQPYLMAEGYQRVARRVLAVLLAVVAVWLAWTTAR